MKVHETRSQTHAQSSTEEEGKVGTRKQKAENEGQESEQQASKNKKAKVTNDENGDANGKSAADVAAEFEEFCKATREHLSIEEMRRILEANGQDSSGSDDAIVRRCQDMMFYGPPERCPLCNGQLECTGSNYSCRGAYSEWTTCTYATRDSPRKEQSVKVPEGIGDAMVQEWVNKQDSRTRHQRELTPLDKPLAGTMISLSGRLSRTHQYWREEIEKHGGKVSNTVPGVTCLVVSPAERERGGSSKVIEAMERSIPVVREAWLIDSIQKHAAQPLDAYDALSDLAPEGRGIPWDEREPSEEALESLTAELKLYGKRGVHKDSRLQESGGYIFEKDGILYNCAFSICDQGRGLNEYCITQLIMVPENRLHLYFKKGRVGDDPRAQERVEEWSMDDAVKEFVRLFEELTGNEFEPWEREKKFKKKPRKFYPIDMDDGFDVRYGGLGLRQLGVAAAHCKLESSVANFMKVLCSQEIYRYALMEMGLDSPDLPMGMLSDVHLKRCEEVLFKFREELRSAAESGHKANALWVDFSNKWFTLMHSTRPFIIRNLQELADHAAAALETVRDINVASRLIGDMTGATVDDPLFDRYKKIGCSITSLDKESDDYKMILKYLEKTYEPVEVGDVSYGVSVDNIFAVESSAGPSYDDIKKLPNKVLLWCGTRSSNLLRHLHKGLLPAICSIPVPGYMFGKAIVCSDAAAEAARYGFTAIDRPEGFLVLAVASLGDQITEISNAPEDTKALEEEAEVGVKGLGRKKPEESEHFTWKDDVKVPCGRLVPSECKDSPLEYNEYAVYDPKQVSIRFLVGVRYEEENMEMDAAE
ncbi:protein ADP-ribosyltransferase PARP3 isoform X2 [Phoenix dactylifera]|uniref:Poly [ADP-ribose] polymerase n=1 Tax=Phoenix dactylifera TaxID=42345 RepID=A0A8B7BYQ9_PHODC|nr:protein ADP-ribosyltransferase PARP3 isoform X2 [Phoenix dactylifera]